MSDSNEVEGVADNAFALTDEAIMDMSAEQYEAHMGGEVQEAPEEGEEVEEVEEEVAEPQEELPEEVAEVPADDDNADESDEEESDDSEDEAPETNEAQAQLDKLFTPFAANGKEMKVNNIEEAVTLMQRGANYNKKMAQLKPGIKVLKMLENNGLMDENKLNYLIDLDKKNPDAIAKFIKESGVDPLEFDMEKDVEYAPENHSPSDKSIALDTILDSIRDTPTYQATMELVGSKWDETSKSALVAEPKLIAGINTQMANGMYEKISAEMERERAFGRLDGVSDLDAYMKTGQVLFERGDFGTVEKQPQAQAQAPDSVAPKDTKRKANKRAASPTRSSKAVKNPLENVSPWDLSDEEFTKLTENQLY
jgi:hypothetical protein